MDTTTNLNLKKPGATDYYDIADFNTNADKIDNFAGQTNTELATLRLAVGAPLVASTVAEMTDRDRPYVYTGSETGYTAGNWYYYNGSAWVSGGVYNSAAVETDKTLLVSDVPADAKKTGDEITDLKSAFNTATLCAVDWDPQITNGEYIQFIDGSSASSTKYARTSLWYGYGQRFAVDLSDTTYEYAISYFDETGDLSNGTGYLNDHSKYASGLQYIPSKAIMFGLSFRRVDKTDLTNSDITAISSALKCYAATDKNLEKSGMAADSKGVGDNIAELKSALKSFSLLYAVSTTWDQGYIRSDGTVGSDSKSCVTRYIESNGYEFNLTLGAGYRSKVALYNSSEDFEETLLPSAAGNRTFIVPAGKRVRIQVSSDSNLAPSNIDNTVIQIAERRYTDTNTIKKSGIPADAKEVADFLDGIVCVEFTDYNILGGYYDVSDGNIGPDTHYARTDKLMQFSGETVFVKIGDGYKFAVRMWDENGSFVSGSSGEYTTEYKFVVPDGWTVAFNFRNDEVTTLDNTDYATIMTLFKVCTSGGGEFIETSLSGSVDFDTLVKAGTYRVPSTSGPHTNAPTSDYGRMIVFSDGSNYSTLQLYISYKNNVYTRILQRRDTGVWSAWALVYNDITGGIGAYLHDGNILKMSENPESIPVNENHLNYNDFIAATWENFLPDDYTAGDAYDASTTKIINIHVSCEADWESTPYGANTDTYTIYRYVFTPINGYKKTVFLSAGCHGNEAEGYWGLYRLMRMIYFESYKYPTLRNLRDNVRFVIVPSWNPWGMQHYRRYNAFEDKNLQAWSWLYAENHQITVGNTVYDISDVGEADVIWDTLNDYSGVLSLWIDMHTDPYAGRTTSAGEIDDPRGYTPPYGFYGFTRKNSNTADKLRGVMEDYYNLLKNENNFSETWHLQAVTPNPSGSGGFSPWMASLDFPTALVEVSTFMENFPYASGSGGMMKLAQEYYGNCLAELMR